MLTSDFQPQKQKWPALILWVGLFGIVNFVVGFISLLPPIEGKTVYFWLIRIYGYPYLPSKLIPLVSLIVIALCFTQLDRKRLNRVVVMLVGIVLSCLYFVETLGFMVGPNTTIIGQVEQDNRIYYLVKYYNDLAVDLAFCKSDKIGFSGKCTRIAWLGGTEMPEFYIDQTTNLITVRSEDPSFIWANSVPPSCINDVAWSNPSEHPGGCMP